MSQRLDRNQVWESAKAAINAYEDNPTRSNAAAVEAAVRSIRELNGERFGIGSVKREPAHAS